MDKIDNGGHHKDVMNQFQQGLDEKNKINPFQQLLSRSQLNTAMDKQTEAKVNGAIKLAELMIKHDNKLSTSSDFKHKNAMHNTQAV